MTLLYAPLIRLAVAKEPGLVGLKHTILRRHIPLVFDWKTAGVKRKNKGTMTQRKKTIPSHQKHLSREAAEQYLFAFPNESSRHRLERQLLDDALSSDALDGLSTQKNPQQLAANLADLKNRLGQRVAQQRPRRFAMPFGMQPYAVAASVALMLVCAAAVIFSTRYLWKKEVSGQMAQKTAQKQAIRQNTANAPTQPAFNAMADKVGQLAPAEMNTSAEPSQNPSKPAASRPVATADASTPVAPQPVASVGAPAVNDTPATPETTAETNSPMLEERVVVASSANTVENDRKFKKESSIAANGQTPHPAHSAPKAALRMAADGNEERKGDASQTARTVRGKVTDAEDGLGLPGAIITVKGIETGTYTDQYGNYSIVVPAGQNGLSFAFIGYITFSTPIDSQSDINVRLTPDVKALSEVAVVGYGARKEKEAAFKPAQPVSGMSGFINTVSQTLSASPYASQLSASGTIRVSFTVQPDGSLSDVKAPGSGCAECEAETVKALQQASRWQPAREDGVAVPQKMKLRIPIKAKKSE